MVGPAVEEADRASLAASLNNLALVYEKQARSSAPALASPRPCLSAPGRASGLSLARCCGWAETRAAVVGLTRTHQRIMHQRTAARPPSESESVTPPYRPCMRATGGRSRASWARPRGFTNGPSPFASRRGPTTPASPPTTTTSRSPTGGRPALGACAGPTGALVAPPTKRANDRTSARPIDARRPAAPCAPPGCPP